MLRQMLCLSAGPERRLPIRVAATASVLGILLLAGSGASGSQVPTGVDPWFAGWETITVADGLPSERVLAVEVDGETIWAGTENGLARVRGGRIDTFGIEDGLPLAVVTALDLDPVTGDLWIGTLGGLARYSAGRIDAFTQLDSGLANDVVYGVAVDHGVVWAATASGLSRYDIATDAWEIFDTSNTLMHEPWCYGVAVTSETLYVAIWGGGVLELDLRTGVFRDHRDPDGEMEIDLFRDDGLVHDVTSAVASADGLLWVGTYFGLSRYDGRRWQSWGEEDSGLAGNFINALAARGNVVWIATDQGLSRYDSATWHTWRRLSDESVELTVVKENGDSPVALRVQGGPASNTIFGVALQGDDLWLATASGLDHAVARERVSLGVSSPPMTGEEQ